MSTALLVPVLNRPYRVRPLVENIRAATREEHSIWFAASDRPTIEEIYRMLGDLPIGLLVDEGDTYPRRINQLYRLARDDGAAYVFLGADDLLFHDRWLEEALITMRSLPDQSGVVVVNDLHNPVGTSALVAVDYIEEFGATADSTPGVVLHEGYRHCFCDNELMQVARLRGRHAWAGSSIVEHLHPAAGKAPMDGTYRRGQASFEQDQLLFMQRWHLMRET
ncbi:MAG: glycosyltransferase family 2 protein [Gammaproteobacteria bacterium]|nr:glycosyltransferase family 2 protein [Gammaproteobacteria bacterium]